MRMRVLIGIASGLFVAAFAAGAENVMRAPAPAAVLAPQFVTLTAFDFGALLPAPPVAGSLAAQADLETVLQVQASRSATDVAWAKLVEKDDVFNHASVLGAWFAAERLPRTAALFKAIGNDLRALDGAAKKPFLRPRPTTVDPRVQPCVNLPASTSYPSGSAMQAFVWAELLAEVFPVKREALIARAARAAWGRVIGGVHFPTDIEAGRNLAPLYLAECRKNADYRTAFAAARAELLAAAGTL